MTVQVSTRSWQHIDTIYGLWLCVHLVYAGLATLEKAREEKWRVIPAVRMGALKTQVLENASTENASTMQTLSQIKKFGISQVSVVHFQVGWASGLQIGFI